MFPETYNSMAKNSNKGNFIGVVTQPDEKSQKLKDQFVGNYRKVRFGMAASVAILVS